RTAALAAVTRALRKPFALVGVGAAPLRTRSARALARSIVRAADLLILRDEESAEHLAAAGAPTPIRVGADAAWTLGPRPSQAPPPAVMLPTGAGGHAEVPLGGGAGMDGDGVDHPVVVALSHLAGGPELPERLAAGLRPVLGAGLPVRLDPWQADG